MLKLESTIKNVGTFLTLKELLLLYICNKYVREQTQYVIPIWKHHCDQLSTLLELNTIKNPKYGLRQGRPCPTFLARRRSYV
jgi:hypothetical protein